MKQELFKIGELDVMGRATFMPPFRINSSLQNEARFVHVIHGNSKFYSPVNKFDLFCGDNVLMKCDNFVNSWEPNPDGKETQVIAFQIYPEVLEEIYDGKIPGLFSGSDKLPEKPLEKIPPNALIDNLITNLIYYIDNPKLLTEELVKVKLQELIHVLVSTDETGRIKGILASLFNSPEYEFKEVIHSHLYEDVNLEELAYFTGLSLSSFKRKFKAIFNSSPAQYIKGKRLDQAKLLLDTTKLRISEIAYDCGFNDIGYFSKSFQTAFNVSPSEYRKS